MLPPSGSWRAGHVDHLACLPDRVHGRRNVRQRCIGPLVFAGRRSGPLEILRDGDRTDVWRPYHDRHGAGFAAAPGDRLQAVTVTGLCRFKAGNIRTLPNEAKAPLVRALARVALPGISTPPAR